jgi:hypothetical protein
MIAGFADRACHQMPIGRLPHRLKNVEEKVRGLDAGNVAGALGNVFVCCVELQKIHAAY